MNSALHNEIYLLNDHLSEKRDIILLFGIGVQKPEDQGLVGIQNTHIILCPLGRNHYRVFLMYLLEEIEPDTRLGKSLITRLAVQSHDAFLSFPGSVRCVEVLLERVKGR